MTRPEHGGNLRWAAAIARCHPSAILDFSASINPLGPPESALSAIQTHLHHLRAYPDPNYGELRRALSDVFHLDADWILPGNGSAELLTWAALDLSQLGVTVLVTPAFGDYRRALTTFAVNICECPLSLLQNQWYFSLEGSLDSLQDTQDRGLLLNNPHNPTGMLLSREMLLPLLSEFGLVVVDEAFMDFLPDHEPYSLLSVVQDFPNLVILRSLTKFYSLPGLRLGVAIAHPDRLRRWQKWRDPWPVNCLAMEAGIAAIKDDTFQNQSWEWLIPARSQLFEELAKISGLIPYPGAANFLLVYSEKSVIWLQQRLLEDYQILIRDCLSFPELRDRFFRIAIRTPSENQLLLTALSELFS